MDSNFTFVLPVLYLRTLRMCVKVVVILPLGSLRRCPYIIEGLRRAGFAGGWLRDLESQAKGAGADADSRGRR
jgi:hypothetical protein